MKLTMLGTGNASVTECYNTCFLLSENREHLLVDGGGGNGILRQLKLAKVPLDEIHDIFITHKHTDHLLGILWVLRMISQQMHKGKYSGNLRIYGHEEVLFLVRDLAEKLLQAKDIALFADRIRLREVKDAERLSILGRPFTFFDIGSTKAKQFGFMLEIRPGERLCCCGDEPFQERERVYARGCKWLLHEAFCLYGDREIYKPYEKHHSTVKDACELAESLGAEKLILYHTEDSDIKTRKERYSREGRMYYHGELFVPEDLESFEL